MKSVSLSNDDRPHTRLVRLFHLGLMSMPGVLLGAAFHATYAVVLFAVIWFAAVLLGILLYFDVYSRRRTTHRGGKGGSPRTGQ